MSANVKVVWHGDEVREGSVRAGWRAMTRLMEGVERQAKLNASGRPGPRVVTGRLRSSIAQEVFFEGNVIVGVAGTNVEYGPRVELGFIGTDSLGRQYHQPPYPFLTPAFEYLKGFLLKLLAEEHAR